MVCSTTTTQNNYTKDTEWGICLQRNINGFVRVYQFLSDDLIPTIDEDLSDHGSYEDCTFLDEDQSTYI